MIEQELNTLRELALKATWGKRKWSEYDGDVYSLDALQIDGTDNCVLSAHGEHTMGYVDATPEDRKFIAACDPETILGLLQDIHNLKKRLEIYE